MVDIAQIKKVDYRLTWLIGHRNMYNIAAMFLAFWIMAISLDLQDPVYTVRMASALILFTLGGKWALAQIWDNTDAMAWADDQKKAEQAAEQASQKQPSGP